MRPRALNSSRARSGRGIQSGGVSRSQRGRPAGTSSRSYPPIRTKASFASVIPPPVPKEKTPTVSISNARRNRSSHSRTLISARFRSLTPRM